MASKYEAVPDIESGAAVGKERARELISQYANDDRYYAEAVIVYYSDIKGKALWSISKSLLNNLDVRQRWFLAQLADHHANGTPRVPVTEVDIFENNNIPADKELMFDMDYATSHFTMDLAKGFVWVFGLIIVVLFGSASVLPDWAGFFLFR